MTCLAAGKCVKMLDSDPSGWFAHRMAETTKQRLLRVLCPDVDTIVSDMLTAGSSWRQVADALSSKAGITVSHESLRQWYGETAA